MDRHVILLGSKLHLINTVLLTGLELALNSWLVLGVVLLVPIVTRQAVQEEAMLRQTLEGYTDYCTRTKRFIPFVV